MAPVPSVADLSMQNGWSDTRAAVQEMISGDDIEEFRGAVIAMAESDDIATVAAAAFKLCFALRAESESKKKFPAMPRRSAEWRRPARRDGAFVL